jgi:DNA-binding response OmpR family regulator
MLDKGKILLVDDEPLVLRSMAKTLLRAGFDVHVAEDARVGFNLFQVALDDGEPFDVAIVDLHMPDLDGQSNPEAGLHLLSELLTLDASLPVVVLSAFDQVTRAKEAVTRGARAYLVKGRETGLVEIVNDIIQVQD